VADLSRQVPLLTTSESGVVRQIESVMARAVGGLFGRDRFDALATGKLADPAVASGLGGAVANRPARGRLFVDGVSGSDVAQGTLADCYLLASVAAVAQRSPRTLEQMIKRNDDGTVTVTFHSGGRKVPITVDADLPRLRLPLLDAASVYGGSTQEGELWPALLEKAYAQWKGGYDAIGNGGSASQALAEISGKPTQILTLKGVDPNRLAEQLDTLARAGAPMTATTPAGAKVTGIVPWHVYTVDGVEQRDGQPWVRLRNPWAYHEPSGHGPNDGAFLLPVKDFAAAFDLLEWVS
jgi:hypothetical protein